MRLSVLSRSLCRGVSLAANRQFVRAAPLAGIQKRWNSNIPEPYEYLNVKQHTEPGITILELKKKPVNSLSLDFLTEIIIAFEKFENDKTVRGVVISSSLPVFSAGLDIMEMYNPDPDRLAQFWHNVQEMSLRIFNSPKAVISAIDGPCIAGGCIFAWGSDYRIMADGKNSMGLNETKLGLAAPPWLAQLAIRNMGLRNAEKMLQLGELYGPQDSLRLGMVDEVCGSGQALDTALGRMTEWLKINDSGRAVTKQMLRKDWVDLLQRTREADNKNFCSLVQLKSTQKLLKLYVDALKAKSG